MDGRLREGVLRYGGAWGEVSKHMNPCMCPNEELEKRWECSVAVSGSRVTCKLRLSPRVTQE